MTEPNRLTLIDLSLPVRLTLAVFLMAVGLGFLSALVNLKFQEAGPGNILPDDHDLILAYHGQPTSTQLERLLMQPDIKPFNGQGSMRSAFTFRVAGLSRLIAKKKQENEAELKKLKEERGTEKDKAKLREIDLRINALSESDAAAANDVRLDLDGERVALILWLRSQQEPINPKDPKGEKKDLQKPYEDDAFELPPKAKQLHISPNFVDEIKPGIRLVKIKSILERRCVRCHSEDVGGAGSNYPLDSWEHLKPYAVKTESSTGKSLNKLALTTHVHLLGFAVLFGMTGLIFAFSSYPWIVRLVVAPLTLAAQVVDISFWWLSLLDDPYGSMFAVLIKTSGGIVAASLFVQIVLGLFNLFRITGKIVIVLLLLVGAGLGYQAKVTTIDPYLAKEKGQLEQIDPRMPGATD
jgi:hypothetical protein